eukprot:CAMPEP_0182923386 /NCGR_PEP_ID=MMETSP0105_2-20130417/5395_1 /TAXON_ID=81532 ORGANISM="Acanthoeca-like sp., Strain 10tr" /NCGR_SAMPLE_ID=MMETSP0105_2 /ASSEMBLY_ACC=CAM_ASM_000205 /LENGTH=57 /DNA_ID=CAMNT_0025061097 /DNA_START=115 /DNA_END=285 /DNA_ORIENTATION=+
MATASDRACGKAKRTSTVQGVGGGCGRARAVSRPLLTLRPTCNDLRYPVLMYKGGGG